MGFLTNTFDGKFNNLFARRKMETREHNIVVMSGTQNGKLNDITTSMLKSDAHCEEGKERLLKTQKQKTYKNLSRVI